MRKIGLSIGLALTLLVAGCGKTGNLFSFTHKADAAGTTDLAVLTSDAQAAVEAGDYAKAQELYQRAVDTNPTSSEARIGVVNAVTKQIQQQGFDLLSLTTGFTNQKSPVFFEMIPRGAPSAYRASTTTPSGYYLFSKDPVVQYGIRLTLIAKLYKVFIQHLGPICAGSTDLTVAKVPSVVFANLSFGYLMRGVFSVVDQNEDGAVDYVIFFRNSNKQYEVYNTSQVASDTSDPTGSPKTSTDGILSASVESAAKADLDAAITYMTLAKNYSQDKTASLWTSILDVLTKAKTMIDDLRT